jgi:hypothetical protein
MKEQTFSMSQEPQTLSRNQILQQLSKLFLTPAHDRSVYIVFGPYERLRPFQASIEEEVKKRSFDNQLGRVEYLSLTRDLYASLKAKGTYGQAQELAKRGHEQELRALLSRTFRDLITSRIEAQGVLALILADFELLYLYDLGANDISIVRQVAINGRRVCLLVPGAMHDGRLWIFDHDIESRREFPETLVFLNSGWVFALADEKK